MNRKITGALFLLLFLISCNRQYGWKPKTNGKCGAKAKQINKAVKIN